MFQPYQKRHHIAANRNDDPSSEGYIAHALDTLRSAMDLFRNKYEPSCGHYLMTFEYPLRDRSDILLSQLEGEDVLAPIERGTQLAQIFAWMTQEQQRLKPDGKTIPGMMLRHTTLLICKKMLPLAHQHYRLAPHLFYDLLLSEAQLQFTEKEQLDRLRQAARGARDVRDRDHRAQLYGRIALMYYDHFGAWVRALYWRVRAELVYCSCEARNQIGPVFLRPS